MEDLLKPWRMGTHLGVLSESYLMSTNMTGFRCSSKALRPSALDDSSLSIGRVRGRKGLTDLWQMYDIWATIRFDHSFSVYEPNL